MCSIRIEDDGTIVDATAPATTLTRCCWCGAPHGPLCPHVKAIEFDETGLVVKRVEFHAPQPLATGAGQIAYYPRGVGSFTREYTVMGVPS